MNTLAIAPGLTRRQDSFAELAPAAHQEVTVDHLNMAPRWQDNKTVSFGLTHDTPETTVRKRVLYADP